MPENKSLCSYTVCELFKLIVKSQFSIKGIMEIIAFSNAQT